MECTEKRVEPKTGLSEKKCTSMGSVEHTLIFLMAGIIICFSRYWLERKKVEGGGAKVGYVVYRLSVGLMNGGGSQAEWGIEAALVDRPRSGRLL